MINLDRELIFATTTPCGFNLALAQRYIINDSYYCEYNYIVHHCVIHSGKNQWSTKNNDCLAWSPHESSCTIAQKVQNSKNAPPGVPSDSKSN